MTRFSKTGQKLFLLSISVLAWTSLFASPLPQPSAVQQAPPDNTKNNKGAAQKGAVTADKQALNSADQHLTQKIRASVMKDKSLSTYAHNVKIISQDGKVTLKGPVRTEEEKAAIEAKAVAIAGDGKVTNEITIAPKQ